MLVGVCCNYVNDKEVYYGQVDLFTVSNVKCKVSNMCATDYAANPLLLRVNFSSLGNGPKPTERHCDPLSF